MSSYKIGQDSVQIDIEWSTLYSNREREIYLK